MTNPLNLSGAGQAGQLESQARLDAICLQHEVEQFYYREAALLDGRNFEEWLGLLAEDLTYWMPVRVTRSSGRETEEFSRPGEGALFDETKELMRVRVRKLRTGFAWAEEPHSRTRHMVTNVRVLERLSGDTIRTESNIALFRSRLENMEDRWFGRRADILRKEANGFVVVERAIYLDHTLLTSPNLSVFF